MSRTNRCCPKNYLRRPKGRRRAIINNARKGSIPPSAYDDINRGNESWLPYTIVCMFIDEGMPKDEIIKRIMKRFKMKRYEALELVTHALS